MPLDLSFKRATGKAETLEETQAQLASVLPEIAFEKEVSGAEKIRLGEAAGATFPDAIRNHLLEDPGAYVGVYEKDGVHATFSLGTGEVIETLDVEIRGGGSVDPLVKSLEKIGLIQVDL